jgi:ATP synthase protein I
MGYKSTAYNIVLAQTGIALALAVVCTAAWGWATAGAALTGAAVGVVTNLYMAVRIFGDGAVRPAQQTLQRFYSAEAVKIAMTIGLFALAIGVFKVAFLPLIVGYSLTLMVYWLALLPVRAKLEFKLP